MTTAGTDTNLVNVWRARRDTIKAIRSNSIRASAVPRPPPKRAPVQEFDPHPGETAGALNDLLLRWHRWQVGFSPVPVCGADPMFRDVKSGKTWDSTGQVIRDELDGSTMEAIDFHVGELPDVPFVQPYRSAIYTIARNLHSRGTVWMSARLPTDPLERGVIYMEARNMLMRRLMTAGVM